MEINAIKKRPQGFTLLETLVAISAIASVGILIAQVFFTTTRSNTKTELLKEVKQNGDFALEMMARVIRNSVGVTSECIPFPSPGVKRSSVDIKGADGNVTTFGCFEDEGVLRIASTSAVLSQPFFLTNSNVSLGSNSCVLLPIDNLNFTCISYVDQPSQITIQFRLSQRGTPPDQFEKASNVFQTTVTPRN
jgi:prepilin-type N-terminal cleavage/methylation domain-containing protein